MKERHDIDLDFLSAKTRYLQLLYLYWILAHRPPNPNEQPYDPPRPPWL